MRRELGCVYFFKQKNIDAVKIGYTSKNDVSGRWQSFKMYAPFGAEVLGIIQTMTPRKLEAQLHRKYKHRHLTGEFYDITIEDVKREIKLHDYDAYTLMHEFFEERLRVSFSELNDSHGLKTKEKCLKVFGELSIKENTLIDYNDLRKKLKPEMSKREFNSLLKNYIDLKGYNCKSVSVNKKRYYKVIDKILAL